MAKRDTAKFLRLMNAANNSIAERAAEAAKPKTDVDSERLKRDAERRDKQGGQLRAREHPRSRPKNAHPVFGHVDLRE